MIRLLFVLLISSSLLPIRAACSEEHTFKLGVILPQSGPLAVYGAAAKNGFEMARKDHPALFSDLELRFEDDQYDARRSIAAFNKLQEFDRVDLLYLWGAGPAHAVAPIAESRKIPLVIMSIDPAPALKRRWVVRFGNYSEQYILAMLGCLRANSVKRIGLVRTELAYINSMVDALRANLLPDESIVEVATIQPGDSDLKPIIARLGTQKFDALAVYLMSGQFAQFYRDAANRFSARMTFGTDFFESMTEVSSAGSGMIGAVFPNNAVEPWFAERYRQHFGNDEQITFAANAYDFAMLAAETFGSEKSKLDSVSVLERIRNVAPRRGASGEYRYKESEKGGQYFEFPIVIRKVEANSVVTIDRN